MSSVASVWHADRILQSTGLVCVTPPLDGSLFRKAFTPGDCANMKAPLLTIKSIGFDFKCIRTLLNEQGLGGIFFDERI